MVTDRRMSRNEHEQQRGIGRVGLCADVILRGSDDLAQLLAVQRTQQVRELTRIASNVPVDLITQLGTGALLDNQEDDRRREAHHSGHPNRQPSAQAGRQYRSNRLQQTGTRQTGP
jgi:hypothetical protein